MNIFIFFLLIILTSCDLCAAIKCVPQLQGCLKKIQMIPEAQELIEKVQMEGNVTIRLNNARLPKKFGAYWDGTKRHIVVNYTRKSNEGTLIGSILFELHNAAIESKLKVLDQKIIRRQISRDKYVEAVEHLEYINSLKASAIVNKGILQGIFPKSAHLHTYPSFEEHFRIQKKAGHSAFVGKKYDRARLRR